MNTTSEKKKVIFCKHCRGEINIISDGKSDFYKDPTQGFRWVKINLPGIICQHCRMIIIVK